jgi:hypothetical protein
LSDRQHSPIKTRAIHTKVSERWQAGRRVRTACSHWVHSFMRVFPGNRPHRPVRQQVKNYERMKPLMEK